MNPCFAAEKTLGKLAKWLRLLGFDTLYDPEITAERLFEIMENDRIVLTRTQRAKKQLASRKLIFIESDHLEKQLNQVLRELDLKFADTRPFSRCLQCNVLIVAAEKYSVWGRVPDYIFETHDHFQHCPGCGRIYWPGSHTQRSLEKIRQLFN
jgi:uncharacterized protein with PIN domain